jgi:hypothetical protein
MTDNDIDIHALLRELGHGAECGYKPWRHAALTALVAERDEYKARCKAQHEAMTDMVGEQRNADRELRERLICAALNGILSEQRGLLNAEYALRAIGLADATLAAIRKGER